MIILPIQHADTAWSGFEPLAPIMATHRTICRAQLAAMEDDTMPAKWQDDIAAARYGMAVYTSRPGDLEPYHLPHMAALSWPWADTAATGKLTEAELDAHNAEFHPPRIPRSRPAIFGPYRRPTIWRRLWARWRVWRAGLMGPRL